MKNVLIASYNLEVGGVERSLVSMLHHFDYENYNVDLMLYSHNGEFMNLLPGHPNLLKESKSYRTFGMSIGQTVRSGQFIIGLARLLAKYRASQAESSDCYLQMQYVWKYSLPFLPSIKKKYDVAISYLGPHYFVGNKVNAKKKIAWIHTDYSSVDTDITMDLEMWSKFDHIMAVSDECKNAFLKKYSQFQDKVVVMENITFPEYIKEMAKAEIDNPLMKDPRFKIITVARLSFAKGIDNAVRALKMLKNRGYKDIVWYIVGYGADEPTIRELIAENGLQENFILLGKATNPYPFIQSADLYVQPSRYEGKAVTVTEAKILGKPILITNYATSRSQVQDGVDGIITEQSVEGIASGIVKLYHDQKLRDSLAASCYNTDYSNNYELNKLYQTFG